MQVTAAGVHNRAYTVVRGAPEK